MAKKKSERQILVRKTKVATILHKRISKKGFWAFCLYYDPKFFSKRLFLKKVAEAFMRMHESHSAGTIYRLAVSMLPRAGKSYILSLFVARMYGRFPEESVIRDRCSDTLYNKLSYDTRDIVKSKRYKEIFPDIHLKGDKQNVKSQNVKDARQVSYFGGGTSSTVIDFGASMLAMTDDLYRSLEDALSDNNNEKVWSWKQGTYDSRIEESCCMIDIGTRWSFSDVLGRMEEAGKYNGVIRIAVLDGSDKTLCTGTHTTEYYQELRSRTGESIWIAEYMQGPFETKGLLFPKFALMRLKGIDIAGKKPDGVIGGCDTVDKGDDDFCAPFTKVLDPKYSIIDILFTKDPVEITEPRLAQMVIDMGCGQMRIKSNSDGRVFAIHVRKLITAEKKVCTIQARLTTQHKPTRIIMEAGWIRRYYAFLGESEYAKGLDYGRFMKALTSYKREGDNTHDDAPDGMTILTEFAKSLGLKFRMSTRRVGRG